MAIGDVTGSVPDVASLVLGVSEALNPEKGFAFNLCSFTVDLEAEKQPGAPTGPSIPPEQSPGSLATPRPAAANQSLATLPGGGENVKVANREGPVFFEVGSLEGYKSSVALELGIREIVAGKKLVGVVELRKLAAFDTGIGDQLAVEVAAQDFLPAGVLLLVKGFVNPAGIGYAHFVAGVLARVEIGAGGMKLRTEGQFYRQEPRTGSGAGIFGKIIWGSAQGDRIRIRLERAPMFNN